MKLLHGGVGKWLVFFLFLSISASSSSIKIVRVKVEGLHNVPSEEISSCVSVSPGEELDFFKLEEVRKRIESTGYFSSVEMDLNYVPDGVEVVYRVEENPVVKGWKVVGSERLKLLVKEKEREFLGKVGNYNFFSGILEEAKKSYYKDGYLAFRGYFFFENGEVVFEASEGILEKVEFEGAEETKEFVLRRATSCLKLGEPLKAEELRKALGNLYNLGIFEEFPNFRLEPGSDFQHVSLVITLKEGKNRRIMGGVGYGSLGFSGTLQFQTSNFRGRAEQVSLNATVGKQQTDYYLSFYSPYFFSTTSFGFDVFRTDYDRWFYEEGEKRAKYSIKNRGGSVYTGIPLTEEDWKLYVTLSYSKQLPQFVEGEAYGEDELRDLGIETGRIFSVGFKVVWDTRLNKFEPRKGFYWENGVEFGSHAFGGDFKYFKQWTDARLYIPVVPKLIFAARWKGIKGEYDLPVTEYSFLGGSETVRGYEYSYLKGPCSSLLNVELRYQNGKVVPAIFYDYGSAGDSVSFKHGIYSVGAGIRVRIGFFGAVPIRFDYGYSPKEKEGKFWFGIGNVF